MKQTQILAVDTFPSARNQKVWEPHLLWQGRLKNLKEKLGKRPIRVIFGVLDCPACSHHPALFEAMGHNGWSLCKPGWDIGNGLIKHSSCQQDEAKPKASLQGWVSPSLGLSPSSALRATA